MRNKLISNLPLRMARKIELLEHQCQDEISRRLVAEEESQRASQEVKGLDYQTKETLQMIRQAEGSVVLIMIDGKLQAKMSGNYMEIMDWLWMKHGQR
jgi:hypothetical protein